MKPKPDERKREWLSAFLCFLAAGCFFISSAIGRNPYYLSLVVGIIHWIAGFVWLVRCRPTDQPQRVEATAETQSARG
jgi:hypothetical protein